jgi:hypothetical protein
MIGSVETSHSLDDCICSFLKVVSKDRYTEPLGTMVNQPFTAQRIYRRY